MMYLVNLFRNFMVDAVYKISKSTVLCCYCSFHAGLKLNLFIEQSQYIPELSHTAGARVVIHDQGQIPFPNNEGYSVLPSKSTSFAIRRVRIRCDGIHH